MTKRIFSKMDFVKALDLAETGVGVTTNLFKFGDVALADLFCVFVLTQESVEDVGTPILFFLNTTSRC
jgi:hypothetical protein